MRCIARGFKTFCPEKPRVAPSPEKTSILIGYQIAGYQIAEDTYPKETCRHPQKKQAAEMRAANVRAAAAKQLSLFMQLWRWIKKVLRKFSLFVFALLLRLL